MNGRPWTGQLWPTQLQRDRSGSFKEGDQVRLECLSSGGKPAPRIEWLNVSVRPESVSPMVPTNLAQRLQVEPMRTHWQLKKPLLGADGSLLPVTSSSVSVSLSRFDLNSNFVCLLLAGGPAGSIANEQLMRSPTRLAGLLASLKLQQEQASEHTSSPVALMSRWLKLPVSGEYFRGRRTSGALRLAVLIDLLVRRQLSAGLLFFPHEQLLNVTLLFSPFLSFAISSETEEREHRR